MPMSGLLKRPDVAGVMQHLVDNLYPPTKKIVFVRDNMNAHHIRTLYLEKIGSAKSLDDGRAFAFS